MKQTSLLPLLPAVLALLAAGCSRPNAATHLIFTGSSTMAPMVAEIGKRFEEENPGLRVDVQMGGSSRGIADARQGRVTLGMVSRSLDPAESDLHAFPLARDGVCIIVNAKNPVAELTEKEIVAVYTGQIHEWNEVGGRDAPITVVNKAEGRATLEVFLNHFHLESRDVHADVIIGDNEQAIKMVAGNPDAIGYVSIGTASFEAKRGVAIKLLPLDGVAATTDNVANGSFPMSRTLNFVSPQDLEGPARAFFQFSRSGRADDLIQKEGFVPLAK